MGGGLAPFIGMSNKMQNGKNTTFLALLRLFYTLERDLKRFLKHIFKGGANFQKQNKQINKNFEKW